MRSNPICGFTHSSSVPMGFSVRGLITLKKVLPLLALGFLDTVHRNKK